MNNYITPSKELFDEAKQIQSYTEITPSDNPNEIMERITDCGVFLARTSKMLADAKYHLTQKKKDETIAVIKIISKDKLSAKVQNSLIESICRDEQYLVDWIEQINKTLKYQIEAARSLLSYEKENMRIAKSGY